MSRSEAPDRTAEPGGERRAALVAEIRDAAASADTALEVYRAALGRVTPLLEASFASVFLRDPDQPELLRLACAQNWPQSSARFLSELRIRKGRGPTGQAVAERRPVEVEDIFEDPELESWWEPARELGFVAMTSHPLTADDRVLGAVSLYFDDRRTLGDTTRSLLATAAEEMAAAAEAIREQGAG